MSLYKKRNSKYWWMDFRFDGNHIQKSTKCTNRRQAEEVERAYRTQLAKGEVGFEEKKKSPKFSEAIREFNAWIEIEHQAKPRTVSSYLNSSRPPVEFFGDKRLDRINAGEIERFKMWRTSQRCKPKTPISKRRKKSTRKMKQLAPATVNRELAYLKKFFNHYIKSGYLTKNPVSQVKMLREQSQPERVLSRDEEAQYLAVATQPLHDVAIMMLNTGMRPGEVFNLLGEDVYLKDGYLIVQEGKTSNARRLIPLTIQAREILETRSELYGKGLLFVNEETGRPFTTLKTAHAGTLRRSGVEHFRPYDLRHTFATRFIESGGDIVTLSQILGHSKIQMTTRYAHPTAGHKFEAIRKMESSMMRKETEDPFSEMP